MTTRSIVTSQPDVACDVCARRLLRGEQPDFFLVAGRRRTVCELCAPRAAHEGWLRESDQAGLELPPMRPRRGRSFIDRLRSRGAPPAEEPDDPAGRASRRRETSPSRSEPYDLFDGLGADRARESAPAPGPADDETPGGELAPARIAPGHLERAVEIFNTSEFPRRIAGVARSLGAPVVNVRSAEHLDTVVRIVIAWELCWYRYEVDLGEVEQGARAIGQGTELSELDREECEGNAVAVESGAIELAQ
jgi:hypothetical protein